MRFILLFFILLLLHSAPRAAATDPLAIDSAFVSGRYEQVELLALRQLSSGDSLSPDARAKICLTTGYALIMLNRETDARDYFSQALDAVPTLALDPILVSPKFRMVFDEVKAERSTVESVARRTLMEKGGTSALYPVRTSARVLNLFLPGVGQMQEGRVIKGTAFLALQTAATIYWIVEQKNARDSRADYLAATTDSEIRRTYDDYNSHHKNSWAGGIAAGAIYVLTQLDLAVMKPQKKSMRVSWSPTANGLAAVVSW